MRVKTKLVCTSLAARIVLLGIGFVIAGLALAACGSAKPATVVHRDAAKSATATHTVAATTTSTTADSKPVTTTATTVKSCTSSEVVQDGTCFPKPEVPAADGGTYKAVPTLSNCVSVNFTSSTYCPAGKAPISQALAEQNCLGIGGEDTPTGYDEAAWTNCEGLAVIRTYGIPCERITVDDQYVWTPTCLPLAAKHSSQPATNWQVPATTPEPTPPDPQSQADTTATSSGQGGSGPDGCPYGDIPDRTATGIQCNSSDG